MRFQPLVAGELAGGDQILLDRLGNEAPVHAQRLGLRFEARAGRPCKMPEQLLEVLELWCRLDAIDFRSKRFDPRTWPSRNDHDVNTRSPQHSQDPDRGPIEGGRLDRWSERNERAVEVEQEREVWVTCQLDAEALVGRGRVHRS